MLPRRSVLRSCPGERRGARGPWLAVPDGWRCRPGLRPVPAGYCRSEVMKLPPYIPSDKKPFAFLVGEDFVEKHNIAWRVEQAREEANNPILTPQYPWE